MSSDDFFSSFGEKRAGIHHRAGGPPPGPPPPNNSRGPPPRSQQPQPQQQQTQVAQRPRAAPPPARPPPQQQQKQQQQQGRAAAGATAPPPAAATTTTTTQRISQQRRPVAPPPNQSSYVLSSSANTSRTIMSNGGGSNHGMPPAVPAAAAAAAAPQQSYYAQPQQPYQPQQQTPSPPQFQQNYENNTDDWYSPTANETMQMSSVYDSSSNNYGTQYASQPTAAASFGNSSISTSSTAQVPPFLQGSMDVSGRSAGSTGSAAGRMMSNMINNPNLHTFVPQTQPKQAPGDLDDFDNEPPLLEELGINIEHILLKTKAVVVPFRRFHKGNSALTDPALIIEDADLAGPLFLALLLGGELLMSGKMQFGYIYGLSLFGCVAMTLILNLMSPEKPISFWTVTSILGYSLLPVNLLAAIKLLFIFYLQGVTKALAVVAVMWSTTASTRLLELGCGLQAQRYLLAYPIALLYSAFVLITIF